MGEWREPRDEAQRERGRKQKHNRAFVYVVLRQGCENNTVSSLSHTWSCSLAETDVQQGTLGKGGDGAHESAIKKKKKKKKRRSERRATDGEMKVLIMAYGPDSLFVFRRNVFIQ